MHELGIATETYRMCRAALDARQPGLRLVQARVAVGELSAIEPELLRYAWEAVVSDGPDRGAALEIEWRSARQTCAACGDVAGRQPGTWLRLCPRCGGSLAIEGGDELDLLAATGEPEEEAAPAPGAGTGGNRA